MIFFLFCLQLSEQHSIFLEPPSRPTIGKVKPQCGLRWNYQHNELWCGGMSVQHNVVNQGRCGICGDEYGGAHPHQAGGLYATGIIARSYHVGQTIDVAIDLVANHLGFFTFAICPHNDIHSSPSPQCFYDNQLKVFDPRLLTTSSYSAHHSSGLKRMKLQLPANMTCSQCILQYTYTSGNNWGSGPQSAEVSSLDCLDLEPKRGCGIQETFRGCADVCIGDFCPQDQDTCISADKIQMTDSVTSSSTSKTTSQTSTTRRTTTTTTKFTTMTSTGLSTISSTTAVGGLFSTCYQAGVKWEHFGLSEQQYCWDKCLYKPVAHCYSEALAQKICFCHHTNSWHWYPNGVPLSTQTISSTTRRTTTTTTTRRTTTETLTSTTTSRSTSTTTSTVELAFSNEVCLQTVAKPEYSNELTDWYCDSMCRNQPALVCTRDPVTLFMCTCNNKQVGASLTHDPVEDVSDDNKLCSVSWPRDQYASILSRWYCSQKCLNQYQSVCHEDLVSRIVCLCRHVRNSIGDDDDGHGVEIHVIERENITSFRPTKHGNDHRPVIVDVLERRIL